MKLKFLLFACAVAAMGPAREAPAPAAVAESAPMSPEEVGAAAQSPAAPELIEYDADTVDPADFLWKSRPVVVFADSGDDPAYTGQMQGLRSNPKALAERDVVVITDTDPAAGSIWREQLHPRGFSVVILDKDGQVKLRKPLPWDAREISRAIDKFPLRRQEIGRAGLQ